MNSLSWFLYLTDVVDSLGFWLRLAAGVLVVSTVASVGLSWVAADSGDTKIAKAALRYALRTGIVGFIFVLAATIVPGKQTLYMIAASEIGDRLSKTETATEIGREANDILHGYLKKLKAGLGDENEKKGK